MVEELVTKSHRQMKEEEGRRITIGEAFSLAKKRIQELNNHLTRLIGKGKVLRLVCMDSRNRQKANVNSFTRLKTSYLQLRNR